LPKEVKVTTIPSDLLVSIAFNGQTNLPVNAGKYQVIATINDLNYTGSTNGVLTVSNVSPPKLIAIQQEPGGGFRIMLQGTPGLAYRLEASTNLVLWIPVFTTNSLIEILEWTDPESMTIRQRFYRAVAEGR
jgi:hypothetical protein